MNERLRFHANRVVVDSPVGSAYLRQRPNMRPLLHHPDTRLFVDGFPRSANSYFILGLRELLGEDAVSGHTHSSDAVRRAASDHVPTAVVVRNPDDVVNSLCRYIRGLNPTSAYWAYARFHRAVANTKAEVHIIDFEALTANTEQTIGHFLNQIHISSPPFDKERQAATKRVVTRMNTRYNPDRPERLSLPKSTTKAATTRPGFQRDRAFAAHSHLMTGAIK